MKLPDPSKGRGVVNEHVHIFFCFTEREGGEEEGKKGGTNKYIRK